MTDPRAMAAAVELGMLAAARPVAGSAQEALALLDRIVPSDASVLHRSRDDGGVRELAVRNYTGGGLRSLATDFLRGPHMAQVLGAALPPSISTEPDQAFRRGAFYNTHLRPLGFRDGMSAELVHRRRPVGYVHLSATAGDAFDQRARELLGAVVPALARLVDEPGRLLAEAELPVGARAALVGPARVEPVPGHALPVLLDEPAFRAVVRAVRDRPATRLSGVWTSRRGWCRFTLRTGAGGPEPLLLHTVAIDPPYGLSTRELEVLTCLAVGLSNAGIAAALSISLRTVHSHVDSVLRKTGAANRLQAAALARRESVLHPLPQLAGHSVLELAAEDRTPAPASRADP